MNNMSDKKVMMITGTRKGIGLYLSEYYLERGWQVAGCSREMSDLTHPDYFHFECDVADESRVKEFFKQTKKRFGRLDALVNNAGIASMNHIMLTPLSTIERIFRTNVFGSFLFCREAAKMMQKQKVGRIINFATVATPLKLEGEAAYASSKAAIESLTQIMAKEYAEMGITVNAIGPTPIETDLIKSVPKDKMDALINRQSIKRLGEFRDVSNVIDFLIKPESDFITGQIIFLGGV
jgi:3-oxoacyl-[acyl-carrier protein] reductase